MSKLADASDPRPLPPPPLDADACCGQGCDPCVFDLHAQAVQRFQVALKAWESRHPEATASGKPGA